jgi:recombination protein RecR
MLYTSPALETLIERFSGLPTIGRKTAQRLALYLLKQPVEEVQALATAISELHAKVRMSDLCEHHRGDALSHLPQSETRPHHYLRRRRAE